jgi:NMD protein affecting ribosome stability and mRNA decay
MMCPECGREVEKLAAKGLCGVCYKKDLAERSNLTCSGCGQKKQVLTKGLCGACYVRLKRHGSTVPRPRPEKGEHLCLQCNRDPIHAKGLCKVCYSKEHRSKSKDGECVKCGLAGKLIAKQLCGKCYKAYIEEKKAAICIGCEELKPIKAMGMCHKCYQRYLRHDDPTHGRIKKGDEPCSHCGARPIHAKSLCGKCYSRYLKRGDPKRIRAANITECKKCGKKVRIRAKGLCRACYAASGRLVKMGLPEDAYETMFEAQKGVCAICGNPEKVRNGRRRGGYKKMAMDHDHKTGKVRGLLCQMCNQGLGSFKDSPDLLTKAIKYLK